MAKPKPIYRPPTEREVYLSTLLTAILMLDPDDREFIRDNILLPDEELPEAWKRMIKRPSKYDDAEVEYY